MKHKHDNETLLKNKKEQIMNSQVKERAEKIDKNKKALPSKKRKVNAIFIAIATALIVYAFGAGLSLIFIHNQQSINENTGLSNEKPDNSKSLGAFWTISNMQEMIADVCDSATTPISSATMTDTDGTHDGDSKYVPTRSLVDSRDSNEYTISKLADGKCWMTKNLNYHIATSNIVSDGKGGSYVWNVDPANVTKTSSSKTYSFFEDSYTTPASFYSTYGNNEDYGTYYNWYAALASTADTVYDTTSYDDGGSICPAGWRLPYGGVGRPGGRAANLCPSKSGCTKDNNDHGDTPGGFYYLLDTTYSIDKTSTIVSPPFSFQHSGSVWAEVKYGDWLVDKAGYSSGDDYGVLWSSTSSTGESAYTLYFSDSITAGKFAEIEYEAHIKNIGYPVRCVSI